LEQFVGLDVSHKLTHVCVVDREGKALWRGSSSTTPEDIAATVRAHAPGAVRIGFETGALYRPRFLGHRIEAYAA
jgi:transposase